MSLNDKFKDACEFIEQNHDFDNDELLKLYGLYKQATEGDCKHSAPGFFSDLKTKAKYNAWMSNKGMDQVKAMKMYIFTVSFLKK